MKEVNYTVRGFMKCTKCMTEKKPEQMIEHQLCVSCWSKKMHGEK